MYSIGDNAKGNMRKKMRDQKYYKGQVAEFKPYREEWAHVRAIGAIVDVVEEIDGSINYWIQCPNSAHKVAEKDIIAIYIDRESGNP